MSRPALAVRHATSGSCRDAALAPAPLVALKHAVLRFSSQRVMPNKGLAAASDSIGGFSLGSLGAASLLPRSVGNGFFPGMSSTYEIHGNICEQLPAVHVIIELSEDSGPSFEAGKRHYCQHAVSTQRKAQRLNRPGAAIPGSAATNFEIRARTRSLGWPSKEVGRQTLMHRQKHRSTLHRQASGMPVE